MTLISRMKWNTRFRAVKFIRVIGVIRGLLSCLSIWILDEARAGMAFLIRQLRAYVEKARRRGKLPACRDRTEQRLIGEVDGTQNETETGCCAPMIRLVETTIPRMTLISRMKWSTRFRAIKIIRVIGVIRGVLLCAFSVNDASVSYCTNKLSFRAAWSMTCRCAPMLNGGLPVPNKLAACFYSERAARVIADSTHSGHS
jgi:hypothetical protein